LVNCLLQHNRAVNSAAVHVAEDTSASIIDSTLENNTAAVSPKGDGGNGGSVGVIDRAKVSGCLQEMAWCAGVVSNSVNRGTLSMCVAADSCAASSCYTTSIASIVFLPCGRRQPCDTIHGVQLSLCA
jgi:hypothetical protein